MTTVAEAFELARTHSIRHMAACEKAKLRWSETAITETVIAEAARAVNVVQFTQHAEAKSGADWIWWWVDGSSAYGMLVQAKRVKVTGNQWQFDFGYKIGSSDQLQQDALIATAKELGILPVYSLYLGSGDYRRWTPCSDSHQNVDCLACQKRSISLMPALLANNLLVNNASSTYERSVALEDLWRPPAEPALLSPLLQDQLAPDLSKFLETPQHGTRAVTRKMLDRVLRARAGAFSAPSPTSPTIELGEHERLGPVFKEVPGDTGHFGLPYFEHTLRPLRLVPPSYVLEIMTNEFNEKRMPRHLPARIAGVVVAWLS